MPDKSKPKKRIRPVIEEVIETPVVKEEPLVAPTFEEPTQPAHHEHHHAHAHTPSEPTPVPQPVEANEAPSAEVENRAKALITELETDKSDSKVNIKLIFALTIITALIVGFITGGVYVYFTGLKTMTSPNPVSTPTPPPSEVIEEPKVSPTPTPSPVPQSVISAFKVSVLNGSGQVGGAGKVKALLENASFKVGNTGNASNFNFVSTQIQVKESVSVEVVNLLKRTLSGDYSVEVGTALPASSAYDIVVTVGSK